MNSIIETLTTLPLFNGVSRERMTEVVGSSKLHFVKYSLGQTVIGPEAECDSLLFILSGQLRLHSVSADGNFTIEQTLTAPNVVLPDFLFGRETQYPCTATALTAVNIVKVAKAEYLRILKMDDIFMFNFLNHLSAGSQHTFTGLLSALGNCPEERFGCIIRSLTLNGATDIVLSCTSGSIYETLSIRPEDLEKTFRDLSDKGIMSFTETRAAISNRQRILNALN